MQIIEWGQASRASDGMIAKEDWVVTLYLSAANAASFRLGTLTKYLLYMVGGLGRISWRGCLRTMNIAQRYNATAR